MERFVPGNTNDGAKQYVRPLRKANPFGFVGQSAHMKSMLYALPQNGFLAEKERFAMSCFSPHEVLLRNETISEFPYFIMACLNLTDRGLGR